MTSKVPKVLKVKDEEPNEKFDDIHEHLPQMPALILIIGSVRSGKSNLLTNFFCNDDFYKDKFDVVKFISSTLHTDNKGKILSKFFDCEDHYTDKMIEDIKVGQAKYEKEERPTFALVMDDILTKDFKKSNQVSFFSTRFRHYIDMYVIAVQSFRAVSGMIEAHKERYSFLYLKLSENPAEAYCRFERKLYPVNVTSEPEPELDISE